MLLSEAAQICWHDVIRGGPQKELWGLEELRAAQPCPAIIHTRLVSSLGTLIGPLIKVLFINSVLRVESNHRLG